MIEDPNYRWYRRGKEYAGLFRFQNSAKCRGRRSVSVKRAEQREKALTGSESGT
ncbi:hypothetical protein ES707_12237 [subsurface metagenome]